jgi:hypothetical protein
MTLVEVSVVVALSSVVMGVLISLTVALKQRDRTIHSFALESERQSELAELLRSDIRGAVDVSLLSDTVLVMTRPGGGGIRYEISPTNCQRVIADPRGAKPRFDSFAITGASNWSLEPGPVGRRPLLFVTLNRARPGNDKNAGRFPLLVTSVLGADVPIPVAAAVPE